VLLWAKYLRKAPQFKKVDACGWTDIDAFVAFASTPLGLILLITMDQFLHIACLLPVAVLVMA
jgi:hypothetical protein